MTVELADVHEPLTLADGTQIDPQTGLVLQDAKALQMVEVPSASAAVELIVQTRRKIADLPALPKQMHVVGAVLSYRLFGFDDQEIALATGMTEEQVGRVIMSDAYKSLNEKVVEGILVAEADNVRNMFTKGARSAAATVTKLAETPNALGFRAAKDVLDRAGMRPADVVEHRHRLDGQLQIVHLRREDKDTTPTIEGLADALDAGIADGTDEDADAA